MENSDTISRIPGLGVRKVVSCFVRNGHSGRKQTSFAVLKINSESEKL